MQHLSNVSVFQLTNFKIYDKIILIVDCWVVSVFVAAILRALCHLSKQHINRIPLFHNEKGKNYSLLQHSCNYIISTLFDLSPHKPDFKVWEITLFHKISVGFSVGFQKMNSEGVYI